MTIRTYLGAHVQRAYETHVAGLQHFAGYIRLKSGTATRKEYDAFIVKVCETHFGSARYVAFVFSLAAPASVTNLAHNLTEEMGTDSEVAHSELLVRLLAGAELVAQEPAARQAAQYRLRDRVMEPLFYGSLREVGLAALVEIVGFEFMLSRMASEFAALLRTHRDLTSDALEWFTHHSEVDIEHAEQGLDAIEQYVEYYQLDQKEAADIIDSALQENIYIKYYFGSRAAADANVGSSLGHSAS